MKINETQRLGALNYYQKQNESRVSGASQKRKADEVRISEEAKEMLSSSQTANPERAKHIEQLKQSVATGSYHVEAGKIAEKLLPYLRNN
ncbi:flagellar biosynthesis anti-sigma factor FlgM [Paenibacillus sp. NEAU-GSW1]|uniref:flagellar biosynthesis anti-sigma factor FlgM n=1 Tax=Paenibacillus sp. NEAU-GSW1 TaxID=2682486 RepID=UPI0012E1EC26|nr:flagellar biosynthesis anti-sigma factor FlgM [Paenibacillus sp. NEAU-GSW1]MUT65021.1 flagellar biosynthesis anti-sigma factor FlgM [Paenibacillus sp. NEAU-GSW1]